MCQIFDSPWEVLPSLRSDGHEVGRDGGIERRGGSGSVCIISNEKRLLKIN